MEKNVKVSVVIPVYNVQKYLRCCIDSIIKQTYQNLEIILVDDGSTDESGKICDQYVEIDSRVHVLHKKNGGLSDARNAGIKLSKGQYLYFLDSDDAIPIYAIEKLLNACETEDADVAMAGISVFTDILPCKKNKEGIFVTVSKVEALRKMLLHDGVGHEAWGKLYKKSLWENEDFPNGMLYEDYATIYHIVGKSNKIVILSDELYFYRIRNNSIMKSKITKKNLVLLDISNDVTNYLKKNIPEIGYEAQYLQMVTYLKLLKGILDNGMNSYPEAQDRIKRYVFSCKFLLKENFVKRKDILKARALMINKYLFYLVYSLGEINHPI